MKLKDILPQIMATITRHPRYEVLPGRNFEWCDNLWTHNVFRMYEMIFGRRFGVRRSVMSEVSFEKGIVREHQYGCDFEGKVAVFEAMVRSRFVFKPRFVRVHFPALVTPEGFTLPSFTGYSFAIARDASGDSTPSPNTTNTYNWNHTVAGSDTYMVVGSVTNNNSRTYSGMTYNSVAMTSRQTAGPSTPDSRRLALYSLHAPSSGTNSVAVTLSGNPDAWSKAISVSYTGVDQSTDWTTVHNSVMDQFSSTTTATLTITVNVANSALVGFFRNGNDPTAGTGTAEVLDPADNYHEPACFESNPLAVSTGSQSIIATYGASTSGDKFGAALAPAAAAGPTTVKTWDGVTQSTGVKTYLATAVASVKSVIGAT